MTLTREERVEEFVTAAGKKIFNGILDESIVSTHAEETVELFQAVSDYITEQTEENRAQLCKEWADVQYTLSQIAWYFDIPADDAFSRVADNNMTKVVEGKVTFREDGKILKPENYIPADMRGL